MTEQVQSYLALGSNVGDKLASMRGALAAIAALPGTRLVRVSGAYRTPPWGKTDQDWFANAAAEITTTLPPLALLDAVLAIEAGLGRERRERWGPRIIDIDLLTHGDTHMRDERLTLPHPFMHQRAFVLVPLQEIAPDLVVAGKRIPTWLAHLDQSDISRIASLTQEA
ncbi:MAG: 2-amino-4-hydroxy-6-hydroxymethyldihydropteridine diphosphokinase [Proteobacteria bacterium]|nr:2-amino-4-hydroxy-6-hydroxymethyldihydropteridine diphosphokinase [Pseudomonadota bacterium]